MADALETMQSLFRPLVKTLDAGESAAADDGAGDAGSASTVS
jgi:hypothetical protein